MKKHLTSIQSTQPGEQLSIFSYDDRQMKLNYKTEIKKLFNCLNTFIKLRSYLLFRDFQQLYQNCKTFFIRILFVSSAKQLFTFAFPNKKQTDRVHEKDQIAFLIKIVFQLDKMRKNAANQGNTKQFQAIKNAIEFAEQKTAQYEQAIRKKKQSDMLQQKYKEKQKAQRSFSQFEQSVRQNLEAKQQTMKTTILYRLHNEGQIFFAQTQRSINKHIYKAKPSKLLSEAKDLSLRIKMSPYAAQLKRNYDYKTLENSLSKTLDLDMSRKLSMIAKMKQVEKDKLNMSHKKRYSVIEDRLDEQKHLAQRNLLKQKAKLDNSFQIDLNKLHEKSIRKQHARTQSLQKSFNAYNMHSDTRQIKKILKNHKETIQFSNQISEVANLRTTRDYLPTYGTKLNMMLQDEYLNNEKRRQSQYEKRMLRKFNKSKKQIQKEGDSDKQADDKCLNQTVGKIPRQKSLVALYDNELNEVS